MNDLVDTTEMYLRTIYDLEEEGVVPLRARIAERLDQSGPTVSQTVSRMERDGLLQVAGGGVILIPMIAPASVPVQVYVPAQAIPVDAVTVDPASVEMVAVNVSSAMPS